MSNRAKIIKLVVLIVLGAASGFIYYKLIGCNTGTCALKSNPYITTAYGAAIGLVAGIL